MATSNCASQFADLLALNTSFTMAGVTILSKLIRKLL